MENKDIMTTAEAVMDTVGENVEVKDGNLAGTIISFAASALAVYGGIDLAKRGYKWIKGKISKAKASEPEVELAVVESDEVEESK